jgi:hypothetical protein
VVGVAIHEDRDVTFRGRSIRLNVVNRPREAHEPLRLSEDEWLVGCDLVERRRRLCPRRDRDREVCELELGVVDDPRAKAPGAIVSSRAFVRSSIVDTTSMTLCRTSLR